MITDRESYVFLAAFCMSIALNQSTWYSKIPFPEWSIWFFFGVGVISFVLLYAQGDEK